MDRELQSVAFAEKAGVAKRSVVKMAVSGPCNMVGYKMVEKAKV